MIEETRRIIFISSVICRGLFVQLYRQPQYMTAIDVHLSITEVTLWLLENKAVTCATGTMEQILKCAKERLIATGKITKV